jgi:hypothetical protein
MKVYLLTLVLFFLFNGLAQPVVPFVDFNNYFRVFENDNFRTIELQPIISYQAGDEFVAYMDNRENLRIFDGKERKDVTNMNIKFSISDHLLAYNVGPTLNIWDAGKLRTLTYFSKNYVVKDSIIVYEDTRYNSVNVYYNKQTYPLYTITGELYMPTAIGDNIVAFKDNGSFYKVFYRGQIYDLGVWNNEIDFKAGCDILCFNDPTQRSFALFEKGEFLDVESQYMRKYKSGRGFIVYEDLNGNLWYYKDGEKTELSNFSPSFWEVQDDMVIWGENNYVFAYSNGEKKEVCNFIPKDYLLKNGVFAFRNIAGGVSAFVNGKIEEITLQGDSEYSIYGNLVLVKLFNKSYIVLKNGEKFFSL